MTGGTGPISDIISQVCVLLGNLNSIPLIGPTLALFATTICNQSALLWSAIGF